MTHSLDPIHDDWERNRAGRIISPFSQEQPFTPRFMIDRRTFPDYCIEVNSFHNLCQYFYKLGFIEASRSHAPNEEPKFDLKWVSCENQTQATQHDSWLEVTNHRAGTTTTHEITW